MISFGILMLGMTIGATIVYLCNATLTAQAQAVLANRDKIKQASDNEIKSLTEQIESLGTDLAESRRRVALRDQDAEKNEELMDRLAGELAEAKREKTTHESTLIGIDGRLKETDALSESLQGRLNLKQLRIEELEEAQGRMAAILHRSSEARRVIVDTVNRL